MISKIIGVVAFLILTVMLINVFVSNNNNSFKSETTRIGNSGINNIKEVDKAGTIYTAN